eukprot:scaffold167507_cov20-Cyclotella_meneghiniana.AAC.1
MSPVCAVPVEAYHFPVYVQLCSSLLDDHNFNQHCPWRLWLLVRMADAASNLGASSWCLAEAFGPLDRVPALSTPGSAQILSSFCSSVSLWRSMVYSSSSQTSPWGIQHQDAAYLFHAVSSVFWHTFSSGSSVVGVLHWFSPSAPWHSLCLVRWSSSGLDTVQSISLYQPGPMA